MRVDRARGMRRLGPVLAGALALVVSAACGSSTGSPVSSAPAGSGPAGSAAGDQITVAYVPGVSNFPYFDTAFVGARDQAKKYGYTVEYVAVPAYDPGAQNTALNAALSNKPDFLLVSPVDDVAQRAAVQRYIAAGIPVITVGGTLTDKTGLVSEILTDNHQGGELAADYLGESLGGKGTVVSVDIAKGSSTLAARVAGFEERLAEKYPDITVLPVQYGGASATQTQQFMRSYLLAHPEVTGVFGVAQSAGEGAAAAVKAVGQSGKIKIATFDASPEQVKALKAGTVDMLSASKPGAQLALAIDQVHAYLTGDKASIRASTQVENIAITRDNVDSAEIKPFLYVATQ